MHSNNTHLRPRVLFVSGSLANGGAERVTAHLVNAFSAENYRVGLCLVRDRVTYPIPDRVDRYLLSDSKPSQPILKSLFALPWLAPGILRRLGDAIAGFEPDVIISNSSQINCLVGAHRRIYKGRGRWIARVGQNPQHEPIVAALASRLCRSADRVVVNSHRLRDRVAATDASSPNRFVTIPNPVDAPGLSKIVPSSQHWPSAPAKRIVAVGRLIKQKRFDILIEAFKQWNDRDAHLLILGEGPLRHELEQQIDEAGLSKQVTMPGFVDQVHETMAYANCFVSTSDYEGSSNALLEAQAIGLPAIATNCDFGPDELIEDGQSGLLTPCRNVPEFVSRLQQVFANRLLRSRLGECGQERAGAKHGMVEVATQWQSLVRELVSTKPRQIGQVSKQLDVAAKSAESI